MLNDEEKKWAQFRDITEIMEKTTPKQLPEDFTALVMARLPEGADVPQFSLRKLLSAPVFPSNLAIGFRQSVTKKECAFYFILTGFFYFIIGFILLLGLSRQAGLSPSGWLAFQPLFGLLLAAGLTIIGIAVYTNGDSSVRFVRTGTILYAALIILNGGLSALYIHVQAGFYFAAIFSLTGLGIALFLGLAVDRYHPETIFAEVSK